MVRPRIEPVNSLVGVSRISWGSAQLFVGPASSAFSEQMKVRASTRATSRGSKRAQKLSGRFDSARRSKVPCSTKSGQSRSYSSRLPSHHSTRSGAVSEEKSSTKRRRPVWVVGAVVMGFFLGCRVVGWAAKLWPTAPSWPQREPVLPALEGRWTGLRSAGSADRVRRRFATRWTSRTRTRAMAGLALSGHGQATVDGGLGAFATRRGPGFRSS